ncbi:MAG TPA: helix-hairpin-helix domain-containing protein [Solirubrobacteraceae bacterium]|nr:helix-hairpin-helix domain-containing protein [Solirubrobacteraceae bacterium]
MTWLWWAGTLIPFGFLTPVLFAAAAARVRKREWWLWAAVYAVVVYGGLVMTESAPDESDLEGLGAFIMSVGWIAGAGHGFVARREYAKRLAGPTTPLERARDTISRRQEAQRLALREPRAALEMGLGRPDVPGATHMGVVDVNHAGIDALARLPGVSDALAREIAVARTQIDGFKSVEDLGVVLRLDADAVEDLRPYVVFLPR